MQFLVQKLADQWVKDNPDLYNDIGDLCAQVTLFNAKWGTSIDLVYKEVTAQTNDGSRPN